MRRDVFVREHEVACVLRVLPMLSPQELIVVDTLSEPPTPAVLDGADVLLIGGSGDFFLAQGDIPELSVFIQTCIRAARERGLPILGLCFGAQLMTLAFGGTLVHDVARAEMGTFDVSRLAVSDLDPIFRHIPRIFPATFGHKEHLSTLPEGAVWLAATPRSPYQAFTFPGKPIYGVVFHPEIDAAAAETRMRHYQAQYHMTDQSIRQTVDAMRPCPDAARVPALFFERVVQAGERYPIGG